MEVPLACRFETIDIKWWRLQAAQVIDAVVQAVPRSGFAVVTILATNADISSGCWMWTKAGRPLH